jgi:hypothetical protein
MKTFTATKARNNLGLLMKRALDGEDIGIIYSATGRIIALRPVEVYSDDEYCWTEYGITGAEMKKVVKNLNKRARHEEARKWDGTFKSLRG